MKNLFDWCARWISWLYIRCGIMRAWSNTYAWVWQRHRQAALKRFANVFELASFVRALKWRPDSWRELGDAISSVGHIMWLALNEPHKFIGDCDEFGRLLACIIRNELRDDSLWGPLARHFQLVKNTFLLTAMWRNAAGYGGHNVCLLEYMDGTWAYMDYDMPNTPMNSIAEVVKQIRDRYAGEHVGIGYAWSDPETLKCVRAVRDGA